MGYGLPAAIGAQLADPARTAIAVSGDGSIMINIQELATLKRYGLPVKVLLIDNQSLGMVRQWQELFFERRFSEVDLSDNPDFAAVARSFGIDALTLDDEGAGGRGDRRAAAPSRARSSSTAASTPPPTSGRSFRRDTPTPPCSRGARNEPHHRSEPDPRGRRDRAHAGPDRAARLRRPRRRDRERPARRRAACCASRWDRAGVPSTCSCARSCGCSTCATHSWSSSRPDSGSYAERDALRPGRSRRRSSRRCPRWVVHKFGGSSLADADCFRRVAGIVVGSRRAEGGAGAVRLPRRDRRPHQPGDGRRKRAARQLPRKPRAPRGASRRRSPPSCSVPPTGRPSSSRCSPTSATSSACCRRWRWCAPRAATSATASPASANCGRAGCSPLTSARAIRAAPCAGWMRATWSRWSGDRWVPACSGAPRARTRRAWSRRTRPACW